MTREEKGQIIDELVEKLSGSQYFYITDASGLNVQTINSFRRLCYQRGVEYKVVKNKFLVKAMERLQAEDATRGYDEMYDAMHGVSSVMFAEQGNVPAKLLKEFREKNPKPLLKAAYIDSAVFIGDEQLDALVALKSKNELIADVVALLQSPMKTVLGQLQSGGQIIAGIVKTLESR
jgi:large subunit ribosomal protein L10